MTSGHTSHFDGTPTSGVVEGLAGNVLLCDPNDVEGITRIFNDHKDIAAVILEPTGASFGKMPILPSFLQVLRDLTQQAGTVLIFDEVVTGFRVSPGGMQAAVGITPDLTTLAKILSGGLPGGAVVGRKDILDWLDSRRARPPVRKRLLIRGRSTPIRCLAAAGIATLEILASTDACARANAYGTEVPRQDERGAGGGAGEVGGHGSYSGIHIYTNPEGADIVPSTFDAAAFIPQMIAKPRGEGINRAGAHGAAV